MTDEKYFEALIKDREENLSVLEKPSMRGIWKSVVEKYADEAHFVYELLQNADDVSATRAEFILSRDKLIFKHNGTKKFSISNPVTEELDTRNGTLGDINSITSIGNSIKTAAEIGKFGVGFKAVFRYTAAPAIFEKHIAFRLQKIIVPERLPECDVGDDTVFEFPFTTEFPFGIKGCPPTDAYEEISKKLLALNLPTLFLSNLREVKFSFGSTTGLYKKEIQSARTFGEMTAELLKLTGGKAGEQNFWLFSRKFDGKNYSVGYFLENGRLKPVNETAFCFFPTKRETKLKFIIHAPFLLNDSREQILAGDAHNKNMINLLAKLAADSLIYLRELGLIDDGILKILPLKESDFDVASDLISFKPFFTAIKEKMRTEKLLPTRNGHVTRGNAYQAEVKRYADIFSDEQLRELVGNPDAAWVFTTISRRESDKDVKDYVDSITCKFITEENLFRYVDKKFIESQPIAWFEKFYEWIAEPKANRIPTAKVKPFFLDVQRNAVAAFNGNGEPILFLPRDDAPALPKIHSDLSANPKIKKFLREVIGLKGPSLKDEIYHKTGTLNVKAVSKNCIEAAPIDWAWLHKFYKWLSETTKRTAEAKTMPPLKSCTCRNRSCLNISEPSVRRFSTKIFT